MVFSRHCGTSQIPVCPAVGVTVRLDGCGRGGQGIVAHGLDKYWVVLLIAYKIANLLDVERLSKVVFVPAVAHMCHLVDVDFLLRAVAHETVL